MKSYVVTIEMSAKSSNTFYFMAKYGIILVSFIEEVIPWRRWMFSTLIHPR